MYTVMVSSNNPKKDSSAKTKKTSGLDKRYLPRWEVCNKIFYQRSNDPVTKECVTRDLSCAGASIFADEAMTENQPIKLTIYLEEDVMVRVNGRVCWSRPTEKQHLIGVNFDRTSKKAQDLILKYAFELDQDKLSKQWFKGW